MKLAKKPSAAAHDTFLCQACHIILINKPQHDMEANFAMRDTM